ncbi:MAG: hypothetical protein PHQ12_13210 [Chthoniobacteraceae bacterium]|nr:hypothetical protein [Chthoniobacteraceae bacterium]
MTSFAAQGQETRCAPRPPGLASTARTAAAVLRQPPAPVAEFTNGNGPAVGGVLVRMASAPEPLQMLNPLAPPSYGSARSLVTVSSSDGNRSGNLNKRVEQPDGIRFLTFRPPNW